jgi:hypothetical protein
MADKSDPFGTEQSNKIIIEIKSCCVTTNGNLSDIKTATESIDGNTTSIDAKLTSTLSKMDAIQATLDQIETNTGGTDPMQKPVYDPTLVEGDAFAMDNMAEGANTKILTDAERTTVGNQSGTNTGDQDLSVLMLKSVYDPTLVAGDAFAMDNMVEGATTKIFLDTERTKLANQPATPVTSVFSRDGVVTAEVGDYTKEQITGLKTADTPQFTNVDVSGEFRVDGSQQPRIFVVRFTEAGVATTKGGFSGFSFGHPDTGKYTLSFTAPTTIFGIGSTIVRDDGITLMGWAAVERISPTSYEIQTYSNVGALTDYESETIFFDYP